jgi:hypothetical protein
MDNWGSRVNPLFFGGAEVMTKNLLVIACVFVSLFLPLAARADTVVLRDGTSYSGRFTGASSGTINFQDSQAAQYQFPVRDVQSLVFTASNDIVTLRNGRSYSGQFTGGRTIAFTDREGINYSFPISDVASIVFSAFPLTTKSLPAEMKVVPLDTEILVRTNSTIDSKSASPGQTYSAEIEQDILDTDGAVAVPRGSVATLLIRSESSGGVFHSPKIDLDLVSIRVNRRTYDVITSDDYVSNKKGLGANQRTAEVTGGGTALGALVGAVFGGGKGAGIGALSGAGAGAVTQLVTRGKKVYVPAETTLTFRLEKTLVLRPRK